jgi:putative membrane protein insertion efficiency factor
MSSTITPPAPRFLSQKGSGETLTHYTPGRAIELWPRRVVMALIWVYQSTIGPALPRGSCRFEPSCSRYAYTAVERYGVLKGGWLAARRVGRCQPWGGSGYDPVP